MHGMRARTAFPLFLACLLGASDAVLACRGALTPGGEEVASTPDASVADTGATEGPADAVDALDAGSDGEGASPPPHPASVPTFHRPAASACTEARASGSITYCRPGEVGNGGDAGEAGIGCPWLGGNSGQGCSIECTGDPSCTAGANGRCGCSWSAGPYAVGTVCTYDRCASDNVCAGTVCICRETALPGIQPDPARRTTCSAGGNCKVDSDCDDGGYCSPSPGFQCPNYWDYDGYYCHTGRDECINDSDCAPQGNAVCAYNPAVQHWACSTGYCADG
jgi:hypothetical protein